MQRKSKQVILNQEAKGKLLSGVEIAYEAVSNTFGARSNNVAIARPFGVPSVVHDGVTVIRELLPLEDKVANVGAEIVADAADRTNKSVGDGTTAATILTREIFVEANKRVAAGFRPMAIREGMQAAVEKVVESVEKLASPITIDDVSRVTIISAQNEELGELVAAGLKTVGKEGVVTVEESRTTETYLDVKQGMEFDRGFKSPYFITNAEMGEASVEDVRVLVTNHRLTNMEDFAPAIDAWAKATIKNYLIIADDIDQQVLAFLILNKLQGNINVVAVQAPSFGDRRNDYLRDIATITGSTFIDKDAGQTLISATPDSLGSAKRVTSTKDATVIVDGGGAQEDIDSRVAELKQKLANPDISAFDKEHLTERIAKLTGGVAVVYVGAKSEPELKERKERVIDAISAGKAALSDGIVPGGGVALLSASYDAVTDLKLDDERQAGVEVIRRACRAPFRKLMENAGFDPGEKWAQLQNQPLGAGVDVTDGEIKDMTTAGIIDPLSVVRSSLEQAASAAAMLLTTNVVITEVDDVRPEPSAR